MGFRLQHPKEGFECCSIKGAQPRAGRGRRELCCQDLGTVPAGELAVSHPAECLPNTNLEEHIGHEKQISESPSKAEGWVSYQLPRARGQPAWLQRAAQKQEVLAAPPALLQLHTLPLSPSPSLCAFLALPLFLTLSPQKSFLCKEAPPLFEPTPIGSCGSRCAGGEQTPPVGASPLPTCSQP